MIETLHPSKTHRFASLSSWLLWPAALVIGGCMGVGAFYGTQTYRSDVETYAPVAKVPVHADSSSSAYMLLPGSTPTTEADIAVPTKVRPSANGSATPTSAPKPRPTMAVPTTNVASTAKPTATPLTLPPPSATPTNVPNHISVPTPISHL